MLQDRGFLIRQISTTFSDLFWIILIDCGHVTGEISTKKLFLTLKKTRLKYNKIRFI
jgi:hypothetical protein